jgi:hypothetical protein
MFNRTKHVAILGCGPAGMFAAHAFHEAGWDVRIYSKKRRSHMFGAQLLQVPIPGLPQIKTEFSHLTEGTAEEYAKKVYGPQATWDDETWKTLPGRHDAWDIRAAYYAAYEKYADLVLDLTVDQAVMEDLVGNPASRKYYGAIISTIPAPAICARPEEHQFMAQNVWAAGDAPELGRYCPISCPPDTLIHNGSRDRGWYRLSNVFGHTTAEWPENRKPPLQDLASVPKPIRHTCKCWDYKNFHRLGRYGAWGIGILSHSAYFQAAEIARGGRRSATASV